MNKFRNKRNISLKKILVTFMLCAIMIVFLINYVMPRIQGISGNQKIYQIDNELVLDTALASKIKAINYGDWAEYAVDLNDDGIYTNDWKIFYNDGKNVYLIAADYLDNSKIPESAGMTTVGKYNAYWLPDSNFANKTGMTDVTSDVANQFMLSKYKNDEEYKDVTDINSKATAILLDTNIWKDFALGFPGSFAYGSPTIEMWVASWNEKGYGELKDGVKKEEHSYQFDCTDIETKGYGYQVGQTDDDLKEILNVSNDSSGYNDELYFPHTSKIDSTDRYFLSSPTFRSCTKSNLCGRIAECVLGDTDILISLTGETVKAKDLQKDDRIVYYDFDAQTNKVGTVLQAYIHENATNFVRYTFDDNTYLEVTDYHPIYTKEGWKSLTQRLGYPVPEIGDEVKTSSGYKKLVDIKEYVGLEDCYDFAVKTEQNTYLYNYYANDTLVESSLNYEGVLHTYIDYEMDCLVSCSYEGDVGRARMNVDYSNAAIRPIVVLPTTAPGYLGANNIWHLGIEPGELIVHHYLENATETTKIAEDEITNNLEDGYHYTTNPLAEDKYDTDKYEYTGRTTGDSTEGEIESGKTTEVTYWYRLKKHKITTEVNGTGGNITGEGEDVCEEVVHLEDSEKDIVITPKDDYYIKSITINGEKTEFTANADGTYTIPKFKTMTQDIHIVVEFAKKQTNNQTPPLTNVDNTVTPSKTLPQTGISNTIFIIIGFVLIVGIISFIKYKKIMA